MRSAKHVWVVINPGAPQVISLVFLLKPNQGLLGILPYKPQWESSCSLFQCAWFYYCYFQERWIKIPLLSTSKTSYQSWQLPEALPDLLDCHLGACHTFSYLGSTTGHWIHWPGDPSSELLKPGTIHHKLKQELEVRRYGRCVTTRKRNYVDTIRLLIWFMEIKYYFAILELLLCHIDLVSSATPLPYKYLSWS